MHVSNQPFEKSYLSLSHTRTHEHADTHCHTRCHTFASEPLTAKDHRVLLSNGEISAGSHSLEIHCSISTLSGPLSLFALAPQRRSHNTAPLRGKDIRTRDKFVISTVTELIEVSAFWQEGPGSYYRGSIMEENINKIQSSSDWILEKVVNQSLKQPNEKCESNF